MQRYIVKLDVKFELIQDNRSEVTDGAHGLIPADEDGYTFRSRYPFIVAWVADKTVDEINDARYALVEVSEAKLQTQLAHPRDGEVYTILQIFAKKPTTLLKGTADLKEITLSNLIAGAPQLAILEKVYTRNVSARLRSEEQYEYLEELGLGNASKGLRLLITWAIENKPEITTKVTE